MNRVILHSSGISSTFTKYLLFLILSVFKDSWGRFKMLVDASFLLEDPLKLKKSCPYLLSVVFKQSPGNTLDISIVNNKWNMLSYWNIYGISQLNSSLSKRQYHRYFNKKKKKNSGLSIEISTVIILWLHKWTSLAGVNLFLWIGFHDTLFFSVMSAIFCPFGVCFNDVKRVRFSFFVLWLSLVQIFSYFSAYG